MVQPKEGDPMEGIIPALRASAKERLCRQLRKCRDSNLRTRYLVIINLANGRSPMQTAAAVQVCRSSVYRIARRFREAGEAGLIDRREENGERKLDEQYLQTLYEVVASSPEQYGWPRPTWTREMLVRTLHSLTGVRIHVTTMSGALRRIGARRGRPKPTVACPWSKAAKNRRLSEIQQLIDTLPDDEVAVYEDEVDIHLNPKIGLDWMVPGQQKEVLTPGRNQKRYLAGALDTRTGELIWVEGERKTSLLFLQLLWELTQHYAQAQVIHVVLDNYAIHSTRQVVVSLETEQGRRLRLHFLPPYCPDHNRIERVWEDLHSNVTRNHTCREMPRLMRRVRGYLRRRNLHRQDTVA
jgi:transposase